MAFQSEAQTHELRELVVIDPYSMPPMESGMELQPIEVIDDSADSSHSAHETSTEEHTHTHNENRRDPYSMEVSDPEEVIIEINDLPGAPPGTKDPEEPVLEVSENDNKNKEDENKADESKKNKLKWDWEKNGPEGFVVWLKERIEGVPKHSGYDLSGIHRAIAYLEAIDNEVSRIMRLDLEGDLNASTIEQVRSQIDEGLSRLHDRADKVNKHSKNKRRKKKSDEEMSGLIKEAQKITGVQGTIVTVPLLISGIARVCVNSTVSSGHDLADVFHKQCEKYKLNEREKSEVRWLLLDMGMCIKGDRGFTDGEDYDTRSSNNYDYNANYTG